FLGTPFALGWQQARGTRTPSDKLPCSETWIPKSTYYKLKQELAEANRKIQDLEAARLAERQQRQAVEERAERAEAARLAEKERADKYEATATLTALDRYLQLVE